MKENTRHSVYLYDKNQIDIYHKVLDDFNESDCIFSRNLATYMEKDKLSEGSFYHKHILECKVCQNNARAYKEKMDIVDSLIPNMRASSDFEQFIRPEIKEALKVLKSRFNEYNEFESRPFGSLVKKSFKEFFTLRVFKRELLIGAVLASLSFVLLYFLT